jgi:hypothetical protein
MKGHTLSTTISAMLVELVNLDISPYVRFVRWLSSQAESETLFRRFPGGNIFIALLLATANLTFIVKL